MPYILLPEQLRPFWIGAAAGTAIILIVPILYIQYVKRIALGSSQDDTRPVESFWRGVSRSWLFFWIGGLGSFVMGPPPWGFLEYVSTFVVGYLAANAMNLMLVMGQLDFLGIERRREILVEAHDNRTLRFLLFGMMGSLIWILHFMLFRPQSTTWEPFGTLASLLAIGLSGVALGSRYNFGWMVGNTAVLLGKRKQTLSLDEIGVVPYGSLAKHLSELRGERERTAYYETLADFLSWSPWHTRLSRDTAVLMRPPADGEYAELECMLQAPAGAVRTIVRELLELSSSRELEDLRGVLGTLEDGIVTTLGPRGRRHLGLGLSETERWPPSVQKWLDLHPRHFVTESDWQSEFKAQAASFDLALGENSLEGLSAQVPARQILEANLAMWVREESAHWFGKLTSVVPSIEWKQTAYYLKDGLANIEFDVVNASSTNIQLLNVAGTFKTARRSNSLKIDGKSSLKRKLQAKIEPGGRFTVRLRVETQLRKIHSMLSVSLHYAYSLERGRHTGLHRSRISHEQELLLIGERPFRSVHPNPYTKRPTKTAGSLFGRNDLLERLCSDLRGADPPNYLLLQGERRLGKTSLLFVLAEKLNVLGLPTVFVDAQSMGWKVDQEQDRNLVLLRELARGYVDMCGGCEPQPLDSFDHFLRQFADTRVVFLVDEFDIFLTNLSDKEKRFWQARLLLNSAISMVCAAPSSRLRGLDANLSNVLFGEHVTSLGPISLQAVEQLIRQPLRDLLDFEPGAVDAIQRLTGGFPLYVQAVCRNIVRWVNTRTHSTIVTRTDIEDCLRDKAESIALGMRSYIAAMDDQEVSLLMDIAMANNRLPWRQINTRQREKILPRLKARRIIQTSSEYISSTSALMLNSELLDTTR